MKESIDVLRALDSSAWVSGNDIAARLGVSPATARRRIKKLRVLGFDILSSPGQGYRLSEALEFLDPGRLRGALAAAGLVTATRLEVMDTVESTSTRLLRWSGSDDLHGRACVTEYQSQGRGRGAAYPHEPHFPGTASSHGLFSRLHCCGIVELPPL